MSDPLDSCSATNCPRPVAVDDMFGWPWCEHHYFCPYPLLDEGTSSSVDKKERRLDLKCSYCRPHKGENKTHKKRGAKKKPGARR